MKIEEKTEGKEEKGMKIKMENKINENEGK